MLKKWPFTKETRGIVLQEVKASGETLIEESYHSDGLYFVTDIDWKALWQAADTVAKKVAVLAQRLELA